MGIGSRQSASWRPLIGAGLVAGLVVYVSYYQAVWVVLALVVWSAVSCFLQRPIRRHTALLVRDLAVVGAMMVLVAAPLLLAVIQIVGDHGFYAAYNGKMLDNKSLDIASLVIPSPSQPLLGPLSSGLNRRLVEEQQSGRAYLGVVAVMLAAVAVSRGSTRRRAAPWAAVAGIGVVLAAGTAPKLLGAPLFGMESLGRFTPFALFHELPVCSATRVPFRFISLAILGISVLVALALSSDETRSAESKDKPCGPDPPKVGEWNAGHRLSGLRDVASAAALWCIGGLLVVDLWAVRGLVPNPEIPAVFELLGQDENKSALLHIPHTTPPEAGFPPPLYLQHYLQVVHERPIIGGHVSRVAGRAAGSDEYPRARTLGALAWLESGGQLDSGQVQGDAEQARLELEMFGVDSVVLDRRFLLSPSSDRVFAYLNALFGRRPNVDNGVCALWRLDHAPGRRLARLDYADRAGLCFLRRHADVLTTTAAESMVLRHNSMALRIPRGPRTSLQALVRIENPVQNEILAELHTAKGVVGSCRSRSTQLALSGTIEASGQGEPFRTFELRFRRSSFDDRACAGDEPDVVVVTGTAIEASHPHESLVSTWGPPVPVSSVTLTWTESER